MWTPRRSVLKWTTNDKFKIKVNYICMLCHLILYNSVIILYLYNYIMDEKVLSINYLIKINIEGN